MEITKAPNSSSKHTDVKNAPSVNIPLNMPSLLNAGKFSLHQHADGTQLPLDKNWHIVDLWVTAMPSVRTERPGTDSAHHRDSTFCKRCYDDGLFVPARQQAIDLLWVGLCPYALSFSPSHKSLMLKGGRINSNICHLRK